MGTMVYSLQWVMQDLVHQQYQQPSSTRLFPPYLKSVGIGPCAQFSGSVGKLREILGEVLQQRLELRLGAPCAQEYTNFGV